MIVYSKIKTMASSYSYDLRVKVINFLENKGTIKEASRLFNINRNLGNRMEETKENDWRCEGKDWLSGRSSLNY